MKIYIIRWIYHKKESQVLTCDSFLFKQLKNLTMLHQLKN